MRTHIATCTLLLALPLAAQDEQGGMMGMPGPTKAHKHLKVLAGEWDMTVKAWMAPGTDPVEGTARSIAKPTCKGMWLHTSVDGTMGGQPFQGHGYTGYDPQKKKYIGLWFDSSSAKMSKSEGTFDDEIRNLTTTGEMATPEGMVPTRSHLELISDDKWVEKVYITPPEGDEILTLELTAVRSTVDKTAPAKIETADVDIDIANANFSPVRTDHHDIVARFAGEWDAVVEYSMPGAPAMKSEGTEVSNVACGGLWLCTDFSGSFSGMPFEGHYILGFDPESNEFVSYWVDSMSPTWTTAKGAAGDAPDVIQLSGTSTGMGGMEVGQHDTHEWTSDNERVFLMKHTDAKGNPMGEMKITYTRKTADK